MVKQTERVCIGITSGRRGGRKPPREDKFVGIWTPTEIIYGTREGQYLRVYKLDIKGRPKKTEELILVTQDNLRKVLWWGLGIVGIAESTFPHPREWQLDDTGVDMDKLTVKILTGALTRLVG